MIVRTIIGAIVLILSVILYLIGACNIDLWVLIAGILAVAVVLLLQYQQERKRQALEERCEER